MANLIPYRPNAPAVRAKSPARRPGAPRGGRHAPRPSGRTRFGGWRGFVAAAREVRRQRRLEALSTPWRQAIEARRQDQLEADQRRALTR